MLWVTFTIFVGVEEDFSLTCQWYFYGCTLFFSPRLAFWISRKTLLVVLETLLSSTYKCVILLLWIAEGSRSRTGKAMVPKSGLLSLVVNSVTEGKSSNCQLSYLKSHKQRGNVNVGFNLIERFSIECRKTKTKVITTANKNKRKYQREPMRNRSKRM